VIIFKQLKDPEKPKSTYLSLFLKKDKFLPKPDKSLLFSSLHKLEVVFAVVAYDVKNLLEANIFISQALKYSSNNYTSLSDRYTIVNYRRRGQS